MRKRPVHGFKLADGSMLRPGDKLRVVKQWRAWDMVPIGPGAFTMSDYQFGIDDIIEFDGIARGWGSDPADAFRVRCADGQIRTSHEGWTIGKLDPAQGYVERVK